MRTTHSTVRVFKPIRKRRMEHVGRTYVEEINSYKVSVENPQRRIPCGKPKFNCRTNRSQEKLAQMADGLKWLREGRIL